MKRKTFDTQQKADILKAFEDGKSADEIRQAHGVSQATLYKWRRQYSGADTTAMDRIKELEVENRRLKAVNDGLAMDLKLAKEIIEKKP